MWKLPWISREHHDEVLRVKDEVIHALRDQVAALTERLNQPIAVTVKLPEDFAMISPAVVRSPRPMKKREEDPTQAVPEAIDYADVDPTNPVQMAELAAQEFGYRPNAYALSQWQRRIVPQIMRARANKMRNATEQGHVATIVTRTEHQPQPEKPIPADVQREIENAARGI